MLLSTAVLISKAVVKDIILLLTEPLLQISIVYLVLILVLRLCIYIIWSL